MILTRISVQRPVFAAMMMLALMVLGLFAYPQLPVEEFPDIQFPVAVVVTPYPGASPEIVEADVSRPLEEAINSIAGIKGIRSFSYEAQSVVVIEFQLSVEINPAIADLREKVAAVKVGFNDDIGEPTISKVDPADRPVISVAVSSESRSLRDLTDQTKRVIVKRLQTLSGVGEILVQGGQTRQIRIEPDLAQLRALGIGVNELVSALKLENRQIPLGRLSQETSERLVQIEGKRVKPSDYEQIPIARRQGVVVPLHRVARVVDGTADMDSIALINGQPALAIDIKKVREANTIEIADRVKAEVALLQQELPADIRLTIQGDTSQGIRNSVSDVSATLLEGALLTISIVFVFLGSWRSTLITGLTLPIALIGTLYMMQLFGFSINVLTLMALSLCIGLLIDDSIVVRENIVRHLHMGKTARQAALDGTSEIGLAVLATTFSIVAVFLPVGFMGGIIGRFFYQFGVTVCAAVLISMLVSFVLDPMLSSIWPDPSIHAKNRRGPIGWLLNAFEAGLLRVSTAYGRLLVWCLRWRKTVLLLALAALVASFGLLPHIGKEFVPEPDLSEVNIAFRTPVDSSLAYSQRKAQQAVALLSEQPEVLSSYATLNRGEVWIKLKLTPRHARTLSQKDLMPVLRERLARLGGIEIMTVQGESSVMAQKAIQLSIQGQSLAELQRISAEVIAKLQQIPGLVDIESSLKASKPLYSIRLRPEQAKEQGIGMAELGPALRPFLAGEQVGSWKDAEDEAYEVWVQLPMAQRQLLGDLKQLPVASRDTGADGSVRVLELSTLADIEQAYSPVQINRRSLFREVLLTANVAGRPAGDVGTDIEQMTQQLRLPAGYRFVTEGENRDMAESIGYAMTALVIAVIFIYMILASQFNSLLHPLAIMTSLPLALIGVFIALYLCQSTLNIFSIIGIIMLMGLVTKNAILLVDFIEQACLQGKSRLQAITEAGVTRLRPILMTTFAMVFGMLPLALGMGEGGEQRAPMAHAVIGGVLTSTLLTLIVVPVAYTYLDDLKLWLARFKPKERI